MNALMERVNCSAGGELDAQRSWQQRAVGATTIVAIDIVPSRLEMAKELGRRML